MPSDTPTGDSSRTIRVFVSSTFRDMHAERDVLNRVVFPELRSRCGKRGAEFIGVDLRWGVTEDEAEGEGALNICLREIERCRPFFVCLLGDRFGWVPPPDDVPAHVFEAIRDEGALSEIVAESYQKDETTVPPAYRLRREAGRKMGNDVAEALIRFWESRGLPGAGESITAREILRGVFEDGYPATHSLFYLRQPGLEGAAAFPPAFVPVFVEQDAHYREKLTDLKGRIRALSGRTVVRDYEAGYTGLRIDPTLLPSGLSQDEQQSFAAGVVAPADWPRLSRPVQEAIEKHGSVALSGMEPLAERILEDLWRSIEPELTRPAESLDAHQRERAYHERFVTDRTRLFLGRSAELQKLMAYVGEAQDRHPLVVTGEPGAGKSAFMAEAVRICRERHPDALVIPHFIGAAPDSAQLPATLRSLCETLRREFGLDEAVEPDPLKLRHQLAGFLEKAGARRTVIVFLDALNQLDPVGRSHELDWIPYFLAPGTKLVASTLEGDCLDQLRRRVPKDHVLDLPDLPDDDRRALIERFLEVRRKKLTANQLDRLLDTSQRPDARLPLYLLVALEELCLFGDYQALGQRIDRLPERLPELFDQVLARVEHDHGRKTTESISGWLAVSRGGLLESEVLDLLGQGGTFPRNRWTRLYRALEPYFKPVEETTGTEQRGTGRLDFYHDQLRLAAYRRYLEMAAPGTEATEACRTVHRELAGYFRSIARQATQPEGWRTDRVRGLSELPYHQTHGEMWEELEQTLCDLDFIAATCAAGGTYGLVADYDAGLAALPEGRQERERLRELVGRVALYAADTIEYARRWNEARDQHERAPARFPLPRPQDIPLPEVLPSVRLWTEEEIRADGERIATAPTRLDRIRAFGQFVSAETHRLATFGSRPGFCLQEAHNFASSGPVAWAADERLPEWKGPPFLLRTGPLRPPWDPHPACLKTLEGHWGLVLSVALTADGGRAVSAGKDNTLRTWDLESGQCLKTLEGHTSPVWSVALTADGRRAVSGSEDKTLRVWDLESGQCLQTLEGHTSPVWSVALTADGRRAVSGSGDNTLRVWDLESGRVKTLEGHTRRVTSVGLTTDGRRAVSGGNDKTLRVWDLESGQCLKTLEGHTYAVTSMALTADGRRAVSGSEDKTLRAWDLERGQCLQTLEGHRERVNSVALTADGRRTLSGSEDKTLLVWDLESGQCLKTLGGHAGSVTSVALTADGRRAVSGCDDKTLRVWDPESGQCLKTLESHTNGVTSVALTADGRRAVSRSGLLRPDNTLRVWDLESGQCLKTLEGHTNGVTSVALTADGRRAVSGSYDNTLRVWDLESGQCLTLEGHTNGVSSVALTADGRRAVSGSHDKRLRIWDLESGQCLKTLEGHTDGIRSVALTADGRRAVSEHNDNTLRVWDLESGQCLKTLEGHTDGVTSVARTLALTADGRRAVSGSEDKTLRAWDLESGRLKTLEGHTDGVRSVALTADGRRAVSGGYDKTLRVWDLESGQCLKTLAGHTHWVESVALTAGGRRVVSGSWDNTLRVWDLENGQCLTVLPLHGLQTVSAAARVIVAGTVRGLVEVFHSSSPPLTEPSRVTPTRVWRFGDGSTPGQWDDSLTALCAWCGHRFVVDLPGDLAAPGPATTDIRCPAPDCGQPLRLNPFVCGPRTSASS